MKKRVLSTVVAFTFICGTIAPVPAIASPVRNAERRDVISQPSIIINTTALPSEESDNAKVTRDEAKAIAIKTLKNYMGLEISEKNNQPNFQYIQDFRINSRYVWMVSWNSFENEKNISINVSVDGETGKVVSVSNYEYSNNREPKGVCKTEKEAKRTAESFLKRVNPEEFGQAEYMDDSVLRNMYGGYRDTNYSFRFVRKVNGLFYENNYIMVTVNGVTGKVINYEFCWDKGLDFPSPEGVIGKEKALEAYKKNTAFKLLYTSVRDPKENTGKVIATKLIYQSEYTDFGIVGAKDGALLDWQGTTPVAVVKKELTPTEKTDFIKNLQPRKLLEVELDNAAAEKLGRKYVQEIFGDGYDVQGLDYSGEGKDWFESRGQSTWAMQFMKTSGDPMNRDGGNIKIEAKTGAIVSAYKYNFMDEASLKNEFVPKVTWEQGYKKAIEVLKDRYGDKLDKITTEQARYDTKSYYNGKDISNRTYTYTFQREINGIAFVDNSINITVDAETGKVTQLSYAWDSDATFAGTEKMMTPEAAGKIYFDHFKPELSYVPISTPDGKNKGEVILAYQLKNDKLSALPANIDAMTGVFLNYTGQPIKAEKDSFAAIIKGQKHEKELTILEFQGVVDRNNFSMNKNISKIDFLKMLINTRGQMYVTTNTGELPLKFTNGNQLGEYNKYIQRAIAMGLVENKKEKFNPNAKITREEMAEILVKFIQLDKVAKAKGIFKLNYTDASKISQNRYGSVAICKGLGVFENEKQFRPKDKATMLEAAVAIYNALSAIK